MKRTWLSILGLLVYLVPVLVTGQVEQDVVLQMHLPIVSHRYTKKHVVMPGSCPRGERRM